jgi:hypothetical protein
MEYCCDSFASLCSRDKRSAPNIRIIKYDAKFLQRPLTLFGKVIKVAKETLQMKTSSPYRFYFTIGYATNFNDVVSCSNICFCPFCGVSLFEYYTADKSDELAHEF